MNKTTNPNIVIRSINSLTNKDCSADVDRASKMRMAMKAVDTRKYNVIGLVDRTNDVILETRYHNIRDSRGRFARVVNRRR